MVQELDVRILKEVTLVIAPKDLKVLMLEQLVASMSMNVVDPHVLETKNV